MRVQPGPRVYWSIQWRTEEEQQWCCRRWHWQGASSSWHVYSRQFPSKKTLNWPRPLKGSSQAVGCRLKTQTAITLKKTRGISTCCLWCWQEECRQQHWGWKKCKRKIIVAQTVKRLPLLRYFFSGYLHMIHKCILAMGKGLSGMALFSHLQTRLCSW